MQGIHRWPVNSPHKVPVTQKMFPFDDRRHHAECLYLFQSIYQFPHQSNHPSSYCHCSLSIYTISTNMDIAHQAYFVLTCHPIFFFRVAMCCVYLSLSFVLFVFQTVAILFRNHYAMFWSLVRPPAKLNEILNYTMIFFLNGRHVLKGCTWYTI